MYYISIVSYKHQWKSCGSLIVSSVLLLHFLSGNDFSQVDIFTFFFADNLGKEADNAKRLTYPSFPLAENSNE